jgi:hypothetical protein
MADVKDPQKLTDDIAKQENAEDRAAMNKYVVEPVKKAGRRLYENVMGTPEQNRAAQERMDEAKKKKDRESIRTDRSPQYADSQMASTRKQLEEQAKAFKPELDKASKDYDKATGKAKGMKKGGKVSSASSRGDGCAVRGKTKGRMV